jgi:pilus assembly protein CpaB
MDRRFLIVIAISAVFAAGVAGVLYRLAAKPRTAHVATRSVVVAAADLPLGTKIRKVDVKLLSLPESLLPRNSFSSIEEVQERTVTGAIYQDEPLLKDRIAQPGAGAGLAPMIADGHRAMSVRVNEVIGVAGFVQPGMRVDVLVTGKPPGTTDSVTRTVLQNVIVLSSGQTLQAEPKGKAISATVVTLQVTPQEAEILTLASGEGHIQLVLRNPSDSRRETTSGTLLSALYGVANRASSDAEPHPPRGSRPHLPVKQTAVIVKSTPLPPVAPRTVEVVRGTKKSVDSLDPDSVPSSSSSRLASGRGN